MRGDNVISKVTHQSIVFSVAGGTIVLVFFELNCSMDSLDYCILSGSPIKMLTSACQSKYSTNHGHPSVLGCRKRQQNLSLHHSLLPIYSLFASLPTSLSFTSSYRKQIHNHCTHRHTLHDHNIYS